MMRMLFALAVLGTLAVTGFSQPGLPKKPMPVLPGAGKGQLPEGPDVKKQLRVPKLADPAAVRLEASITSRRDATSGKVALVGVVRNLGLGDYRSAAGQQSVELVENPSGGRPRVLTRVPFVNLAPGQEIAVRAVLDWSVGNEFPPSYTLRISYDPDIRIDGNAENDDSNQRNNVRNLAAEAIDRLFGR